MASLFNAFLSDDESEAGANTKTKKVVKPKTKNNTTRPTKTAPRAAGKPQPVAKKNPNAKKPFKKEKILEPSEVSNQKPRGGGGGRGRGPRPGDTNARDKRYFDKKSGTGRGKGAKKGGAGGHNWGTQLENQYNTNFSISGGNEEATETPKPEKKEDEEKDEVPPEPEKETFTINDFLKKKAEKRSGEGFEELGEAKVEEVGAGKAYTKKDKASLESEDVLMSFGAKKAKQKKKEAQNRAGTRKHVEGLGFRVKNPDRERGERRGGYRGRGRGSFRGNRGGYRSRQSRVDVDTNDQLNFPQLGS